MPASFFLGGGYQGCSYDYISFSFGESKGITYLDDAGFGFTDASGLDLCSSCCFFARFDITQLTSTYTYATPVPLPAAGWFIAAALGLLGLLRRKPGLTGSPPR
jgi:hypothetical protein